MPAAITALAVSLVLTSAPTPPRPRPTASRQPPPAVVLVPVLGPVMIPVVVPTTAPPRRGAGVAPGVPASSTSAAPRAATPDGARERDARTGPPGAAEPRAP